MPLGWQRKNDKAGDRRILPAYTPGVAQAALFGELSEPGLYAAQAERYSRSDLVYMCVQRLAVMAAMNAQRLALFDADSPRDPETDLPAERVYDHPFLKLWRQPNLWDSQFEFLESTVATLLLNGNAYWHWDDGERPRNLGDGTLRIMRGKQPPRALWQLRPDRVRPQPDKEKWLKGYLYQTDNHKILFDPDVVRHYKFFHPLRDYQGLSPIEPANYASVADIAAQRSNWAMFNNGVRLSGVIESDRDKIDLNEQALMQKMFNEQYAGDPLKAHQVAFLWQDFKYKQVGLSLRDAEFIDGLKMNRMRIFGVYGLHPAVILSEDSTRTDAEMGEYVTLKYTLVPLLRRIASDITPALAEFWPGERRVEAHFVNVVPQDRESETRIADLKASAAERLVRALGPEHGVDEAKRQGLLTDEAQAGGVME